MSSDADILDRCKQITAELMESDLEVVRHVKAQLLGLDGPDEVAGMMRSYAHASRALRQSVALTEKLVRNETREAREAAAQDLRAAILNRRPPIETPRRTFPRDIAAADARAAELRTAVRRVIWAEGLEQSAVKLEHQVEGTLFRRLEDWISDERCEDDFLSQSLDEQVVEYCEEMELNAEKTARWRDLPEPDDGIVRAYLANHKEYSKTPVWFETG